MVTTIYIQINKSIPMFIKPGHPNVLVWKFFNGKSASLSDLNYAFSSLMQTSLPPPAVQNDFRSPSLSLEQHIDTLEDEFVGRWIFSSCMSMRCQHRRLLLSDKLSAKLVFELFKLVYFMEF